MTDSKDPLSQEPVAPFDPRDEDDFMRRFQNQLDLLAAARTGAASVLVVDDEPDITFEVAEDLKDEGFTVQIAGDGVQALEVLHANTDISVIVADLRMPNMDGMTLVARVNEAFPDREMAVVILTGHGDYADAIEALHLGAFEFLTKPVSLEHLLHVVSRAHEYVGLKVHEQSVKRFMGAEINRLNELVRALEEENRALRERVDGNASWT